MLFFPKRIGRSSYFIRHCAIALLVWGIAGSGILQESEVTGWIFLLLSLIYWLLWVVLPRVRDLSMSAFLADSCVCSPCGRDFRLDPPGSTKRGRLA